MAIIFLRSTIIYVALLIIMRLMGKRQIGEMQPFEFTVTLLIAELACIPMSDFSIPLLYGISAIIAVFVLHQFMSLLDKSGKIFKFAFSGKPSIVINKNGVDFKELKKNNLDVSDLIESMRILGYFSLDAVSYAIYESNGTLSAIESDENSVNSELPIIVVKGGKIDKDNLKRLSLTYLDIQNTIKSNGENNVKNVGVLTVDGKGKYYMQAYNKKYKTGQIPLKGESLW